MQDRSCGSSLGRAQQPGNIGPVLSLLLVCLVSVPMARAAADQTPASALGDITTGNRLRVTVAHGLPLQGRFAAFRGDTLVLLADDAPQTRIRITGGAIRRIEVWDSGVGRGARWGATGGAVTAGAMGGLLGWVFGTISSSDNVGPAEGAVVGATLGAVSGAVVIGGLGAGLGALSSDWITIYPAEETPRTRQPLSSAPALRLVLDSGLAWDNDLDSDSGVFGMRLALLKDLGRHVRMGPAIGYYAFERSSGGPLDGDGGSAYYSTDPVTNMGLDVIVSGAGGGLRPYAVLGTGWYTSADLYMGVMGGGGLLWRTDGGQDFHLDVRRHLSITGDVVGGVDDFTTLSLGITFGKH